MLIHSCNSLTLLKNQLLMAFKKTELSPALYVDTPRKTPPSPYQAHLLQQEKYTWTYVLTGENGDRDDKYYDTKR